MQHRNPFRRKAAALLMSAAMLFSSVHFTPPAAAGTEWVQDAVNRLTAWGVISGRDTGEQQLNAPISRAEIAAMVNRAYGYNEVGPTPFTDVPPSKWYYDDISIGYNAGYFSGASETTADPEGTLTREQAIVLLARNMRMEQSPGEVLNFVDGRDFSTWSMGYIKAAVENGLVNGYSDGTFRPKSEITRAEMIKLLSDSLGTLINVSGDFTLDGMAPGNVTISSPNVTLRDAVIAGDLLLTGGVGLGGVTLQNVRVLGRIVVAGGGESEGGGESVVLRNVEASSMLIDSMADQYVSVRVQGDTDIPTTTVRSNAYIEDNTRSGYGLQNIILDSEDEHAQFTLSGHIKNAVNRTPGSTLTIGTGTAEKVTIDEKAAGSRLIITSDGRIEELNLDAGIPVTGEGDIGKLTVNAAGASTTMLPDEIVIRPGITAVIAGETMDSKAAEESSAKPRLLAGYPDARDIAPTSVLGVFSGNKKGTVYYAVTPEVYGPVEDDDILVNPPTYGPTYTARGRTTLTASETEASVRIGGLVPDGTYYLSAVLVDARGDRSPVKYVKFTTPDNTVPNFTTGYPTLSKITDTGVQLTAMTNKDCLMYFAIYPAGSAAPTKNNFLSNSLEGAIVTGTYSMEKNTPMTEWLTETALEEQKSYDLYLWLNDHDSGLSSGVRKLTFSTVDMTPPYFVNDLRVTREQATSISLTGAINEAGRVYWVAVLEGEEYPKPSNNPNVDTGAYAVTVTGGTGGGTYKEGDLVTITPEAMADHVFVRWQTDPANITLTPVDNGATGTVVPGTATFVMPAHSVQVTGYFTGTEHAGEVNPPLVRGTMITSGTGVSLDSEYAKLQVRNGLNALKSGSVAARANTDFTFIVAGLQPQTRYDIYYIAVDSAGNYSEEVRKLTANTLDNIAPKAKQEFTRFSGNDSAGVNTTHPYANTDIRLVFDEEVMSTSATKTFLELYQDVLNARNNPQDLQVAKDTLGSVLGTSIQLYRVPAGGNMPTLMGDDVIDYRNAVLTKENDTELVITFPTTSNPSTNALHLSSATTYFFRLRDITDISTARNRMGQTDLPRFTTISAQVFLEDLNVTSINYQGQTLNADIAFTIKPASTSTVEDEIDWDMLFWLDYSSKFDLYRRIDGGQWELFGSYSLITDGTGYEGISVDMRRANMEPGSNASEYPQLNNHNYGGLLENHTYDYVLNFTQIKDLNDRNSWSDYVHLRVGIMAGSSRRLGDLAGNPGTNYQPMVIDNGEVASIGIPNLFNTGHQFRDDRYPNFINGHPQFQPGDTTAIMDLMLDRTGTVYYVVAPADVIATRGSFYGSTIGNAYQAFINGQISVPKDGSSGEYLSDPPYISITQPQNLNIVNPASITNENAKKNNLRVGTSRTRVTLTDLLPETDYFVYLVTKGDGQIYSPVQLYTFTTQAVVRPVLVLEDAGNSIINMRTDRDATVDYMLVTINQYLYSLLLSNFSSVCDPSRPYIGPRLSVYEAMNQNATDGSGASLFDQHASSTVKQQMAEYIRSRSGGQSMAGSGSQPTSGPAPTAPVGSLGTATPVDCTRYNMSEGIQYLFVAVAKSPLGSGDAFRSYYPVTLVDNVAPYIIDVGASAIRNGTNGPIIGYEVSLLFSEPLYYNTGSGNPPRLKAVTMGTESNDPTSTTSNFISASYLKEGGPSTFQFLTSAAQDGRQTSSINLRIPADGGYITLTNRLCDAVPNSHQRPLMITFNPILDSNNNPTGRLDVLISPNDWDGRTGSRSAR